MKNKKQLRAISYKYNRNKHNKEREYLESINEYENFKKSKYKYMCNYIKYVLNRKAE